MHRNFLFFYFFFLFLFILLIILAVIILSIITHHSQYILRNNNWSSTKQHIQWKEFQRGIWYNMLWMHLYSFFDLYFLGSKLVHCICNKVLQISWKFYSKMFYIRGKTFLMDFTQVRWWQQLNEHVHIFIIYQLSKKYWKSIHSYRNRSIISNI